MEADREWATHSLHAKGSPGAKCCCGEQGYKSARHQGWPHSYFWTLFMLRKWLIPLHKKHKRGELTQNSLLYQTTTSECVVEFWHNCFLDLFHCKLCVWRGVTDMCVQTPVVQKRVSDLLEMITGECEPLLMGAGGLAPSVSAGYMLSHWDISQDLDAVALDRQMGWCVSNLS